MNYEDVCFLIYLAVSFIHACVYVHFVFQRLQCHVNNHRVMKPSFQMTVKIVRAGKSQAQLLILSEALA